MKTEDLDLNVLEIEETTKTPYVLFKPDGTLLMQGRSISEDGKLFFDRILSWINEYKRNPGRETVFEIYLEYHTGITTKSLMQIIKDLDNNCKTFKVIWKYEVDDENIFELGQYLQQLTGSNFEFIEVEV